MTEDKKYWCCWRSFFTCNRKHGRTQSGEWCRFYTGNQNAISKQQEAKELLDILNDRNE